MSRRRLMWTLMGCGMFVVWLGNSVISRAELADDNKPPPAVKEIKGLTPPRLDRLQGFRQSKPVVIRDLQEMIKVLGEVPTEKLNGQVDFKKQELVLFQWAGSGQDQLYSRSDKKKDKLEVTFEYVPGRTRDLRTHARLFAVRKGVPWSVVE